MPKIVVYLFSIIILFQIIFSFFYSSEIINQNNNLYQNQQEYQKLKIEKQNLEKNFSDLSSIYHLSQESSGSSVIKEKIFINQ